jgi:hypothetical protein
MAPDLRTYDSGSDSDDIGRDTDERGLGADESDDETISLYRKYDAVLKYGP